jgi:MFS family permease
MILFASLVIVMLGFGIVVPILPYYVTHFGVGGQAMGWLMAIFNIGNSLLRPSVASLISQRAETGQGVAMGLENSGSPDFSGKERFML